MPTRTTSAARHSRARPRQLTSGIVEVRAAAPLTPRVRRVTFGGAALAGLAVEQPGEIMTLLWPVDGKEPILPLKDWRFPPGTPEQHMRNFTIRRWSADAATVEIDFVVHGDHGTASRWAARARPGERLGFVAPRAHWTPDEGAAWSLLLADETGLPALAAIAESLPPWHRAIAVVEVADAHERQPIASEARLDLRWAYRGGVPAGESDVLADAVRALALPDGRGRVWGAGESGVMRTLRDHLRDERGIPRAAMQVLGYWKHPAVVEWTR